MASSSLPEKTESVNLLKQKFEGDIAPIPQTRTRSGSTLSPQRYSRHVGSFKSVKPPARPFDQAAGGRPISPIPGRASESCAVKQKVFSLEARDSAVGKHDKSGDKPHIATNLQNQPHVMFKNAASASTIPQAPIKGLGSKPRLPAKPALPSKPSLSSKSFSSKSKPLSPKPTSSVYNIRMRSFETVVEAEPVNIKKKSIQKHSDADSKQPDESKPSSIAERARLFSAEDPRVGAHCQHIHSPAGAGSLAARAWGECGDQGDAEDGFSGGKKQTSDVAEPKLEANVVDAKRGSNSSSTSRGILEVFCDNWDSDHESGSYNFLAGSDTEGASTLEKTVIPLRQNKLLQLEDQDKAASNRGQVRRTSSTDELPVVSVSFTNTRGLFQKAQLMNSCDSLDSTAKPPVAQKPLISKKPAVNTGQDGTTNKPNVPPKVTLGSPPRTIPKPLKLPPKASEQPNRDNIYDEVYHEETIESEPSSYSHDKASSKKLEKILGPDFATSDPARPSIERDIKPVKGKQPMDPRSRKISAPARPTTDDGPYAVIPLPDADKTATKKTKNSAEQKAREISDGNGNKVVLRNSGGMSSGDSGIVGLNTDMLVKRGISRKERRMSRRILRQTIRSMDSDFMEDSDDEPIGVDSDFDSDTSLEEPAVFMDESHKTAFEVLTTERTYVDTLYLINEIFLKGIEKENQKQHWFPPTVVNEIFSNISSIYRLHSAVLLPDLDERLKDWERNPCLGEVLKKNAPFLKLYSDYVSNFDNAMKQLNQWMSKVPKFAATVSQLQNHELCGNLALQHHMLTPVQRIPRYELLLKDYIKKLPDGSKDKADADKALTIISGAAQHSNDMMKSMDQFEKLLKINQKIDGENIIDPTRHLLKEGKITKIAAKNKEPQDRYIFLFNDILLCCEKKRLLTSANYKVKLKMEVDGMKVLDSNSCRFIIESKTKSIEFQTNSEEEREDWMRVLLSAIQEMYWKKETFRTNDAVGDRQNGDEYGVKAKFVPGESCPRWIKDDETSMCMRCGTDFKLTKRRHHCRACGAVVCHKCSNFEAPLEYDDNKMNKVCIKCYYVIKGDEEEIKKLARRSLIPEIDEDNSFSSFLYLHYKGAWTKFWVVVTEQDMFVLKAPKDVRPVFTLPIKLYNIRNINDTDAERDHVFKLSDSRTVHTLSAESKELKRRWMTVLSEGVEKVIKQATI